MNVFYNVLGQQLQLQNWQSFSICRKCTLVKLI